MKNILFVVFALFLSSAKATETVKLYDYLRKDRCNPVAGHSVPCSLAFSKEAILLTIEDVAGQDYAYGSYEKSEPYYDDREIIRSYDVLKEDGIYYFRFVIQVSEAYAGGKVIIFSKSFFSITTSDPTNLHSVVKGDDVMFADDGNVFYPIALGVSADQQLIDALVP